MPFEKVARDTYVSPSGRKFTGGQVRMYYATDGFKKKPKKKKNPFAKIGKSHG